MRCFVCKEKQAEAVFWGLSCCKDDFETLKLAEEKAGREHLSLSDYLQKSQKDFSPEIARLIRFLD